MNKIFIVLMLVMLSGCAIVPRRQIQLPNVFNKPSVEDTVIVIEKDGRRWLLTPDHSRRDPRRTEMHSSN